MVAARLILRLAGAVVVEGGSSAGGRPLPMAVGHGAQTVGDMAQEQPNDERATQHGDAGVGRQGSNKAQAFRGRKRQGTEVRHR